MRTQTMPMRRRRPDTVLVLSRRKQERKRMPQLPGAKDIYGCDLIEVPGHTYQTCS